MILGLTAAGVSEADATAAVFNPAPVHVVPATDLGLDHSRLDAKTRVPLNPRQSPVRAGRSGPVTQGEP